MEFTEDRKALICIDPKDTAKLKFGSYIFDIQWEKADGTTKTIIKPAAFIIEKEVSYDD